MLVAAYCVFFCIEYLNWSCSAQFTYLLFITNGPLGKLKITIVVGANAKIDAIFPFKFYVIGCPTTHQPQVVFHVSRCVFFNKTKVFCDWMRWRT